MDGLLARLALFLACTSLLAGCAGTGSDGSATVELYDNVFEDGNRTLHAGDALTFKNEGQRNHTVTIHWVGDPVTTLKADEKLTPGQSTSYTFAAPGTYHVWCKYHGTMTTGMAIVVTVQ